MIHQVKNFNDKIQMIEDEHRSEIQAITYKQMVLVYICSHL